MVAFVKKNWKVILLTVIGLPVVIMLLCIAPLILPIVVLVGFIGCLAGYFFFRLKVSGGAMCVMEVTEARTNYYKEVDKILEVRDAIINDLIDLNQRILIIDSRFDEKPTVSQPSAEPVAPEGRHSNPCRFFSGRSKRLLFAERENLQRQELSELLHTLMWSYPRLASAQRNDPNYVISAQKELIEHHLLVLSVKNSLFDEVHQTIHKIKLHLSASASGIGRSTHMVYS